MPIATDFLSPTERPLGVWAVAHSRGTPAARATRPFVRPN
jgi:hypothetical protein